MHQIKFYKIVFIQILLNSMVRSRTNIKLTNLQCKILEKKFGEFQNCSLKAVKRDVVELTVHAKLFKPIYNTSLVLSLKRRGDHKLNSVYQYKVDLCEFMRSKRRNPIAEIFYRAFQFQKYSNMNHTCPYDHDLILNRCRLDVTPLTILSIAQGEYTIFTTWSIYEKPAAKIDVHVNIF